LRASGVRLFAKPEVRKGQIGLQPIPPMRFQFPGKSKGRSG